MENNNSSDSWVNIEGNEISRSNELNEENIKLEIKKRLKNLKNDKRLVEKNTSETIENMLAYLNELQKTEEDLYELLKDDNDSSDKNDIINKINDLSSKRDKLYADMKQMSIDINKQNQGASNDYKNQLAVVNIAEKQLNKEKERLKILNAEKYNKLRMVEINTYYSKKYEALGSITIIVIIFFLIALLINYLTSIGIIPISLADTVNPILIGIALFILLMSYFDILKEVIFNFDEYSFMKPDSSSSDGGEVSVWPEPDLGSCVGETCCSEGTTYDEQSDTCVVNKVCKGDQSSSSSSSGSSSNSSEGFRTVVKPIVKENNYYAV